MKIHTPLLRLFLALCLLIQTSPAVLPLVPPSLGEKSKFLSEAFDEDDIPHVEDIELFIKSSDQVNDPDDEPKTPEEQIRLSLKAGKLLMYIIEKNPILFMQFLHNMNINIHGGAIREIDVMYIGAGRYKDAFRVELFEQGRNEPVIFDFALKSDFYRSKSLFEQGELEMYQKLTGKCNVPTLGGVAYVENIGEEFGEIATEPQGLRNYTTMLFDEYIRGKPALHFWGKRYQLNPNVRIRCIQTLIDAGLVLCENRLDDPFKGPFDYHLNNLMIDYDDPLQRAVLIDIGHEFEYQNFIEYLTGVLLFYGSRNPRYLAQLYELYPQLDWDVMLMIMRNRLVLWVKKLKLHENNTLMDPHFEDLAEHLFAVRIPACKRLIATITTHLRFRDYPVRYEFDKPVALQSVGPSL
ncbi:MAG: hypothetical protein GF384_01890 [Elusimicrobia bacterium]|nr:hypothetical protein [Elusimicrobiota bacterium]MBD3411743.1 hypothetical protein [Elusimicrobiota bacterium]